MSKKKILITSFLCLGKHINVLNQLLIFAFEISRVDPITTVLSKINIQFKSVAKGIFASVYWLHIVITYY